VPSYRKSASWRGLALFLSAGSGQRCEVEVEVEVRHPRGARCMVNVWPRKFPDMWSRSVDTAPPADSAAGRRTPRVKDAARVQAAIHAGLLAIRVRNLCKIEDGGKHRVTGQSAIAALGARLSRGYSAVVTRLSSLGFGERRAVFI